MRQSVCVSLSPIDWPQTNRTIKYSPVSEWCTEVNIDYSSTEADLNHSMDFQINENKKTKWVTTFLAVCRFGNLVRVMTSNGILEILPKKLFQSKLKKATSQISRLATVIRFGWCLWVERLLFLGKSHEISDFRIYERLVIKATRDGSFGGQTEYRCRYHVLIAWMESHWFSIVRTLVGIPKLCFKSHWKSH